MSPTLTIVLLWLAFAVSHIALSSLRVRPRVVRALGERGFAGAYSLIALATFVPLVWVYFGNKHSGPMLWFVPMTPPLEALVTLVMGVAVVILVAGIVTPSPASVVTPAGKPIEIKGVHFITRHAVFMAAGLFGLVHLIPNGFASDIAFFAGFPIFALIGGLHQDQRKLMTDPGRYPEFHAATPLIPFTGKRTLRGLRELSPLAVLLGIGLAVILRYFHAQWFGA
jgi:uncharacterized membrane protein